MAEDARTIAAALSSHGVDPALAERLGAYGALLLEANRKVNLTGAKDAASLVPHVLDALTLVQDITQPFVDVGSGGGLPGIPLALATGAAVVLVEPIAKKAAFLARALAECGLTGEAVADRAEVVARDARYREQFAFATARAVSRASTVAELTIPFLRVGGRALLQRAVPEPAELQALEDAAPMLGVVLLETRDVGANRRIFVLEKQHATPPRFPRRNGVPEKRPLCY